MNTIKKYFKKILKIIGSKELTILPAYLSYNFVLAIIPVTTVIVIIASFFSISIDTVVNFINDFLPSYASNIIVNTITGNNFDIRLGIFTFTIFAIAINGVRSIVEVSNNLYKQENNNIVWNYIKASIILIIIIATMLFLIIVPLLGNKIISLLSQKDILENVIDLIYKLYKILNWPITFIILLFNIRTIYAIASSKKIKGKDTTLGAFVTTLGWMLFTLIFSFYINNFASYDIIYGGLSSIAILLIWIYVLSYILILGIIINSRVYNKKNNSQ